MINLLPPEVKQDIAFARRNAGLLKWCGIMAGVILGIGLISLTGVFFMKQSTATYQKLAETSRGTLKAQKLDETQKQVEEISSNLKLASQVLSKEILFSKVFKQIGAIMPAGTNLSDLKINQTKGGLDLTALASNYTQASQVQVNLADPNNKIFDSVDLVSISCNSGSQDPAYPCSVNVRALFGKNNSFLFIGDGAKP